MRKLLLSFGLLFITLLSVAQKQEQLMKAYLDSLFVQNRAMGTVSIYEKGKQTWTYSVGYRDWADKKANTQETKFRLGSVSKSFTAIMIMKAVEEKKLSLDDTLVKFFPTVPNAGNITIRQLLQHRSGIFNVTNDPSFGNIYTSPISREDMVIRISSKESVFEPGTKYQYSNSNYILLSIILEKIYGKDFKTLFEEKIVKPYGLKDQIYYMTPINAEKEEAYSYSWNVDSIWSLEPSTDPSIPLGAGAIIGKPKALNEFFGKLFSGKILSVSSLKEMQQVQDNSGLGIFKIEVDEEVFYGHGGAIDGFRTTYIVNPATGLSIAIGFNATQENPDKVAMDLIKLYKGKSVEIPVNNSRVKSEWGMEQYAGTYETPAIPLKISIKVSNGYLVAQAEGQSSFILTPINALEYEFKPAGVKVVFNGKGDGFELQQGGMNLPFQKK